MSGQCKKYFNTLCNLLESAQVVLVFGCSLLLGIVVGWWLSVYAPPTGEKEFC